MELVTHKVSTGARTVLAIKGAPCCRALHLADPVPSHTSTLLLSFTRLQSWQAVPTIIQTVLDIALRVTHTIEIIPATAVSKRTRLPRVWRAGNTVPSIISTLPRITLLLHTATTKLDTQGWASNRTLTSQLPLLAHSEQEGFRHPPGETADRKGTK